MLAAAVASPALAAKDSGARPGGNPQLGVYVGNDPVDLRAFETWLGRPVDGVVLFAGPQDWADWHGSILWLVDRWMPVARGRFWSIPIHPEGATLEEAAAGRYDARYRAAAQALAAGSETAIRVRTGWEFNGPWSIWNAIGKAEAFVGAFRRFVDQFRGVSDRFVIEWCPNIGDYGMNPEEGYPGDAHVDLIGLDFYYDPNWTSRNPRTAWRYMLERPYGLRWHRAFAADRGKPTAYSEWGVTLPDAGPYVEAAAHWFADPSVVYQSYWNSDAAFRGKLSDGRIPKVGGAYRRAFGPAGPTTPRR